MEVIKISELPETMSMGDDDALAIVKGEATQKISKANFVKDVLVETVNIVHVAKNGDDSNSGTLGSPFLTIGAANDYALANLPVWPRKLVINVAPGIYTEHITNSFYRIYIIGQGYTDSEKDNAVVIRNTGADADHYPIACVTGLNLKGINVETTDENNLPITGVYGPLQQTSTFVSCKFKNGYFINQSDSVGSIYQYMLLWRGGV